jgi:hypothetical protein
MCRLRESIMWYIRAMHIISKHLALRSVILAAVLCFVVSAQAKPRVEMEVLAEPGLATNTAAQQWAKLLAELGVTNVRFRPPQPGERTGVKATGKGEAAEFHITAQMNNRGAIVTPAGQFALSDRAKLAKWLEEMTTAGPENLGQPKSVFGLTARQFDEVRSALSARVGLSTKGVPPQKVIEQIRGQLKLPLTIDAATDQALAADEPVRDELQDLSLGTALAAIARPAGAVLLPQVSVGKIELRLTTPKEGSQSWPIGWPPEGKKDRDLVPMLFDFINVDIENTPASEAITAIQGRLKVPFLFDHNNMVRHRIDLNKKVKMPAAKTYYRRILDRLLFQADLKCEVRVDEAGQPLVWITTLKK